MPAKKKRRKVQDVRKVLKGSKVAKVRKIHKVLKVTKVSRVSKIKPLPKLTAELFDISGKKQGTIALPKEVFGQKPNKKLLAQANQFSREIVLFLLLTPNRDGQTILNQALVSTNAIALKTYLDAIKATLDLTH